MTRKLRVLFSSRDPGGVGHILILLQAFRKDGRFDVYLAASGAALSMLRQTGELPRPFILADGRDHLEVGEDPTPLTDAARRLLDEVRPDAVFACLSSFGVGIDEALLAACKVPSFAMQDFWGDVNLGLGVPARLYFVLDDYALKLTKERWGVEAVAVGSPKHARYNALDVAALRHTARKSLGVNGDDKVVGFFGQSPDIPGHESAYQDLVRAMGELVPRPLLLLREHPKFVVLGRDHISLANRVGLKVADVTNDRDLEAWLAACDVVTTPFSACGLDHAYLSAYSQKPIGSVLYLMTNDEIRAFSQDVSGMKQFPIVERGLGKVAGAPEEVSLWLRDALYGESVTAYFEASKSLRTGEDPSRIIVETVGQRLSIPTPVLGSAS
ncbi:MAG: hypothetical protein ACE5JQ_00260 [Candidatus Methylomirabilales bacterium]